MRHRPGKRRGAGQENIMTPVIYHNPACSTSRKVLGLLREGGREPKIIEYLKTPPSRKELKALLKQMNMKPRDILRKRGSPWEELGLGDLSVGDEAILDAIEKHPILIERPILVTDKGARLCRPVERMTEIFP